MLTARRLFSNRRCRLPKIRKGQNTRGMSKGSRSSRAGHNWPSTTPNPSGKGRYNAPSFGGGAGVPDEFMNVTAQVWLPAAAHRAMAASALQEREVEQVELAILRIAQKLMPDVDVSGLAGLVH